MGTTLLFNTPLGGESIPAGSNRDIAVFDVNNFNEIRVFAGQRTGPGVQLILVVVVDSDMVAWLDVLNLTAAAEGITRVHSTFSFLVPNSYRR
jgi:hypothetical protein